MFLFHSHWRKGQSTSGIKGSCLPQTWWQKQTTTEFFKDFSLQMNSRVGGYYVCICLLNCSQNATFGTNNFEVAFDF